MENLDGVLLDTHCALLQAVTPKLRAVVVDLDKNKKVFYIRFYYDGKASEDVIDLWECAITEASIDMDLDYNLDEDILRRDYPKKIPVRGKYAYLRKEGEVDESIRKLEKLPYYGKEYLMGNIKRAMQNALLGEVTSNLRKNRY